MPKAHLPHVVQRRDVLRLEPGVAVATAAWIPAVPKAVFVYSHGHAEHAGRYAYLVDTMVGHDFAVFSLDHRGHGRSSGPRTLAMRFDDFVDDLDRIVERARSAFPDRQVVLFGHSMGGLIAVRYALAHGAKIDFLITSGPALIFDEGVPPGSRALVGGLARLLPRAGVPRGGGDVLSTDPDIHRQFALDHRTWHGPTRMRTASELLRASDDARARLADLTIPLLAMHGANDRLTSPRGTELLVHEASSVDKTIRLWPGMKHEVLNEPGRALVMRFMLAWLDHRLG